MPNTATANNEELKHRILARKLELEAKFEHLKADTAGKTADVRKRIQEDLDDLGIRIAEGWEHLTANAVQTLNDWLIRTDSY